MFLLMGPLFLVLTVPPLVCSHGQSFVSQRCLPKNMQYSRLMSETIEGFLKDHHGNKKSHELILIINSFGLALAHNQGQFSRR